MSDSGYDPIYGSSDDSPTLDQTGELFDVSFDDDEIYEPIDLLFDMPWWVLLLLLLAVVVLLVVSPVFLLWDN